MCGHLWDIFRDEIPPPAGQWFPGCDTAPVSGCMYTTNYFRPNCKQAFRPAFEAEKKSMVKVL
jgi:hypothetical protein